jgi:hypothetical protein
VALTGSLTTLAAFTIFQLSNAGGATSVNLAIPTADTTTPPAVLTLNDASYNAANPTAPTNRIVTVTQGGITYTSDNAAASVTVQLNTFTAGGSSGSMTGTVVQQGGAATLAINFTWTTGAAAQALGGVVTEAAGRRAITLTDAAGTLQLTILMPTSLPNGALDPVTFNDASFSAADELNPAGRVVTLIEGGVTYSSDVATVGSVTVTFSAFNSGTKVGAGTITGTAVSGAPSTKTMNYSFATTAGGTAAAGTLDAGAPVDITTTSTAAYIAETYGRLTQRPGVVAVSSGVAHANALTGVVNAWFDGAPLLLVSGAGDIRTSGMGHFQDVDQVAMAAPVTRYSRVIDRPDRVVQILDEAWQAACPPNPGPDYQSRKRLVWLRFAQ